MFLSEMFLVRLFLSVPFRIERGLDRVHDSDLAFSASLL